jgi:hypothetical protein
VPLRSPPGATVVPDPSVVAVVAPTIGSVDSISTAAISMATASGIVAPSAYAHVKINSASQRTTKTTFHDYYSCWQEAYLQPE